MDFQPWSTEAIRMASIADRYYIKPWSIPGCSKPDWRAVCTDESVQADGVHLRELQEAMDEIGNVG